MKETVLQVENLQKDFKAKSGVIPRRKTCFLPSGKRRDLWFLRC